MYFLEYMAIFRAITVFFFSASISQLIGVFYCITRARKIANKIINKPSFHACSFVIEPFSIISRAPPRPVATSAIRTRIHRRERLNFIYLDAGINARSHRIYVNMASTTTMERTIACVKSAVYNS